jgi:hypothetical protein
VCQNILLLPQFLAEPLTMFCRTLVQRNPGKVTLDFAVFMLYGRGSLAEGHIFCRLYHLPCFNQGRQERVWAPVTNFFRAPRARVDSLQIFGLNRKDKL